MPDLQLPSAPTPSGSPIPSMPLPSTHPPRRDTLPLLPSIILLSDRFVVIDKPSGLLSVPGKGEENRHCAASWCRERFPEATGQITVHRLDMDTSGLLLMALDADAQRELSRQFEKRDVEKAYVAVVQGEVSAPSGTIDSSMRADLQNRPRQVIDRALGKPAQTAFTRIGFEGADTRLLLVPLTGRTHQLRLHCAAAPPDGLGHPIKGDILYGHSDSAPRLLLHASRLVFTDPKTGERIVCESPAPF